MDKVHFQQGARGGECGRHDMRLISNTGYDDVFVYFPGIDEPGGWTLAEPAVYHVVRQSSGEVRVPGFFNISDDPKFLVFKAQGEMDYYLSLSDGHLHADAYDFLHSSMSDVLSGANPMVSGIIGYYEYSDNSLYLRFDTPCVVIIRLSPVDDGSLQRDSRLLFSNEPLEFAYDAHWIIDWAKRIDGSCWDVNGKVRYCKALSGTGRRDMLDHNLLPVWKRGVLACEVPCSEWLGSIGRFRDLFANAPEEDCSVVDSISVSGGSMGVARHFRFVYRTAYPGVYQFRCYGSGEAAVSIDGDVFYGEFDWERLFTFSKELESGFHEFDVFYWRDYYPSFSFQIGNGSGGFSLVNPVYVGNSCDMDVFAPFAELYGGEGALSMPGEYVHMTGDSELRSIAWNVHDECTLSMWLRFSGHEPGQEYPYAVLVGENGLVTIVRVSPDTLEIRCGFDPNGAISHVFSAGEWFNVCVAMTGRLLAYYFNIDENGYREYNYSGEFEKRYLVGSGAGSHPGEFDIGGIALVDRALKQYEVNSLAINMEPVK